MTLKDQLVVKNIETQDKIEYLKTANNNAGSSFVVGMVGAVISAPSLLLLGLIGCKNQCYSRSTQDEYAAIMVLIGMGVLAFIVSVVDLVDSYILRSLVKLHDYGDLSQNLLSAQNKYDLLEQINSTCVHQFDELELTKFNSAETLVFTQVFSFLPVELLCSGEVNITALALRQDVV